MVQRAHTTAPGPDGISYTAWRCAPDLARRALYGVYLRWMSTGSLPPAVNWAYLALLPKTGTEALQAGDTRPLSMANCDSKLLASALRTRLDPLVDRALSSRQFGFRRSASILTPVVEVDTAMQRVACGARPRGGAIFFDFSAAFPSLAHAFLWAVLSESGISPNVVRAIQALCEDNQHWFPWQTYLSSSVTVRSGVRQGCPLSPTLFSLCTAPVIALLEGRLSHEDLLALFADDIAVVVMDLLRSGSCGRPSPKLLGVRA